MEFLEEREQFEKATAIEDEMEEREGESGTGRGDREKDVDLMAVLQTAVKELHFGRWREREKAARDIMRLARHDGKLRKILAELGVIPPLVSMVVSPVTSSRRLAIQALIELANGTFSNKALMVDAGILSRLPTNFDSLDESTRQDFAQLLLSVSSLASTQFPLKLSTILPFLVGLLVSDSTIQIKDACLGTLYNLSMPLENAGPLIQNGVVAILLTSSSRKETSEKSLSTLGNLAMTLMGKKAMEDSPLVPESLIEIMTWEDKPRCQEISAYILMTLAHQSPAQREKMAKSGIVSVLLEVALLGSTLAQKRALKLLQWFKDEKQVKMGPHSGPQSRRVSMGSPVNEREASRGQMMMMMQKMVKQSLDKNMEVITRRAKVAAESSKLKSLIISSSSKSLPY
ncbi:hypothetical protein Nepgr_007343 [Nepenthes gracilis]|uniref:U-box domain-containing protein 7 n=1 Tax=Nepenthes gracilis TaxID=150966 RepID=A0AAD3XI74_NEPGR|nr:hypothetical protein Nepgr_007343 [Nepenthes gracilis]